MPTYLASELVSAIRATGLLPAADSQATTSALIALMNREQRLYLMRLLQSAREDFQVTTEDTAVVSGQTRYRLPSRASASSILKVELVSNGSPARLTGDTHTFQGHHLVLNSALTSGTTLRFTFPRRFNTIVPAEEAGEITAINTGTNTVTIAGAALPDAFEDTETYDFIQGQPQFDVLEVDVAVDSISGQDITFEDDLPADLAVGDYVALATETPICNAPLELQDVLVYRAVAVHLQSRGDPKWQAAKALLDEAKDNALSLIQPRSQDEAKALINYNAPGWQRVPVRR